MHFASKYCGLNKRQYGLQARHLCYSAILNKILTYDIMRATKKDGAYAEFDAVANYDCMIPVLVVLDCNQLGMGDAPGRMLLDALEKTIHRVQTAQGDSKTQYMTDLVHLLFGTG